MPDLSERFAAARFRWPFRRYQALALDAYERRGPEHAHRCYLVMPPGSGKTAIGLEIIRREGNPAVVFCPNTAVQSQWLQQWADFQPSTVPATVQANGSEPVAFLTYQSLCNLNPEHEELDELARDLWSASLRRERGLSHDAADAELEQLKRTGSQQYRRDLSRFRGRARRMIARGDEPERLLDLLHPNGRALVERIASWPACTLVLDECHHLLEMWGQLIRAVVDLLGENVLVVGLTATPPRELSGREATLYQDLFGFADFEVATPAVVKEGDLAAYQELALVTHPMPHELEYIAAQHLRFEELITDLLGHEFASRSLIEWVQSRAAERFSAQGAQLSWTRFERDNSALAIAALRFFHRFELAQPEGVRIREPHRQQMSADDWVALIGDFCVNYLRLSELEIDHAAWEKIRTALPALGYVLTRRGIRRHQSLVDRVLSLSASKAQAAVDVLQVESAELGEDLRSLILCDYERTNSELVAELRGVLDPDAGSAILLLELLLRDSDAAPLSPVLMTGRTVACSAATAAAMIQWLDQQVPDIQGRLRVEPLSDDSVSVTGPASIWSPRQYVPLITRYFEDGHSRCLIGTRGLLGEGWDAKRVNVLIDLTTASTATAVHQMRGRSLRLDPAIPRKVANNWDVVCIDPDHPRGFADYDRFVRKHRHYFAPNREGEIESGVSHVHHSLSPFGPPSLKDVPGINRNLLRRATEREAMYEKWGIGEPYANQEIHTVRVRTERSLGIPNRKTLRGDRSAETRGSVRNRALAAATAGAGTAVGVFLIGADPAGLLLPAGILAGGTWWSASAFRDHLVRSLPSDNLDDFAAAILQALQELGEIDPDLSVDAIRINVQDDGYYRCYLSGVDVTQSERFSRALDELLAPLSAPRYIIPRFVAEPPANAVAAMQIGFNRLVRDRAGSSLVYHAVPDILARNREKVSAFERAWNHYVSPGRALFYRDTEAQAILAVQGGEDPFSVSTQMRVLWE